MRLHTVLTGRWEQFCEGVFELIIDADLTGFTIHPAQSATY